MKVTEFRRLGLTIGPGNIGWALLNAVPNAETLPRISTGGDTIAAALAQADLATKAGAEVIYLYRYTTVSIFNRSKPMQEGLSWPQHQLLIANVAGALRDAGYTVEFEDDL